MALHLEIILESELQTLINLIKTTQNHNTYVQYSVYIESCAKRLGWNEVLDLELSSNDLLLSGILNVEALDISNSPIKKALQEIRFWDNDKETLLPKQLPNRLKKFIINQVRNGNALIPDDDDCLLYRKTQILIDSIDTIISKASLERNNEKGLIKKNNIYGVYEIGGYFDLELMLEEISNGPFNCSSQVQVHIKKDRSKLSKCGKDALDFVINKYAKSHSYDDLVKMQEIKVYLLHAHETVLELFIIDRRIVPLFWIRKLGIYLYLRLIKEIFNENLNKDHISNYGSKDNEEECEEISKIVLFIPTYNTPRSSIN
ncbi:46266_t:CDS:2 [Gigaspora margarita]|uniref:46266_t:CDS:1 n=1 Tax=Gigaspora margarita TaxID=4874 RepID=A0ABN7V936_GIGMA|nr:46266_t:CDS:2 [Gigaspora margarita]